uniref:ARAD1D01320p n=1 Tax=Blastobotrys adeninivorans TaxID=409370 RepID=A0A060T7P9_BLAAD
MGQEYEESSSAKSSLELEKYDHEVRPYTEATETTRELPDDDEAEVQSEGLQLTTTRSSRHHMGHTLQDFSEALTGLEHSQTNGDASTSRDSTVGPEEVVELEKTDSRASRSVRRMSMRSMEEGRGEQQKVQSQGVPPELKNLPYELAFVGVCSFSLSLYAFLLGDITVNQPEFKQALGISNSELPWLTGSYSVANGLSLVVSGSLMDLAPPKMLMVGSFAWLVVWNVVGVFSLTPETKVLFFIMRAMQGLAIGILLSGSMSVTGRIYKPGLRKNRVFSAMAATAPFGFWLGAIQGGALHAHLKWIFGSNAILCAIFCVAAYIAIPSLLPVADVVGGQAPTLRQFDYIGALVAVGGCVTILFGLTQGTVVKWAPYTYSLVIVGLILLVAFFFVETKVSRPLIPTRLWKTKGFTPLMIAYFLGFGTFCGCWQFYAVQFWRQIQDASSMSAALYLLPNALVGVLATWLVSRTLHLVPGHYIYVISMFAYAMGPAFFLPQKAGTPYWALSMPGVALVTFGPDLAFAAASIFITSNVARSYQGSAGSLLMMMQNLSTAVMTSVADAVGTKVDMQPNGEIGLEGLRAIWWLGLAGALVSALITVIWVRIPKEEEKDYVT